jgi:atypical dual specificity phosphatase
MGTGGVFLRKLRAHVSDEPTGFAWVEDHRLAASGYPASRGQLEWLVERGIGAVLTLTPEPLPEDLVSGLPLELAHVPMQDHQIPTVGMLAEGAKTVRDFLGSGKAVVVHCLAGEGRTGCVLAAYLMSERKLTADEALRTLRAVKPLFVEPQQEKSLRDYQASLRQD